MLRAGTCGAIQDDIEDGALVVVTAAVRDEGLTPRLVPEGFPAVADAAVIRELETAIAKRGERARVGLALSTDRFYPSLAIAVDWLVWKRSQVLAVEMELAPLFVIASLHGVKAGGILAVDGNPTQAAQDMSEYDPFRPIVEEGVHQMLEIAIEALTRIKIEP